MAGAKDEPGRMTSGRDTGSIKRRLSDLEEQLARAKARRREPAEAPDPGARGAALGNALRLSTELIAGVAVGGFIGWALDRWLSSAPFLMVVFLILGAAAGILGVVRSAQAMQAQAGPLPGNDLPRDAMDDDDD